MTEPTETTFFVRYAETDAMGVVHHSRYIVWFEEGRSDFWRNRGHNYADFEAEGYFLAVSAVEARYLAPARYGDRVTVQTKIETLQSRSLSLSYRITNEDTEQLLVTGRTKHVCIDREGKVTRIPRKWMPVLQNI